MYKGYIDSNGLAYDEYMKPFILSYDISSGLMSQKLLLNEDRGIMLVKGERLIWQNTKFSLDVQDKWGSGIVEKTWDSCIGQGPYFVTNRRIIHYREPDARKYLEYSGGTLSLPDALTDALVAKGAKSQNLLEFFEVHFDKISKIEVYDNYQLNIGSSSVVIAFIDLIHNDQRYRITSDRRITDLIIPILKQKEINRESLGKKEQRRTAIWYMKPEDVNEKTLAKCKKLKLKARKSLENGKTIKAIDYLEQAVSFRPNDPKTLDELCAVLFDNKEYQKYLTYIDRCLKMDHSLREVIPSYRFNKGNALFNMKKYDEALVEYQKYIDDNQEAHSINGMYGMAKTYLALGKKAEAENNILKGLEIMPNHPDLLRLKKEIDKHV